MPMINITVRNKIAAADKSVIYVCGNSDYVLKFDFDSEWNAFTSKTARINHGGQYTDVVFSGNECALPVIKDVYNFTVGVYAGDLHTTTPAFVFAKKSILCEGGIPADPVPSVYTQVITALNGKANSSHTHSYDDLTDKPEIPEAYDDTEVKQMIQGKAAADHTHSYNALTDKPEIPAAYDDTAVRGLIDGLDAGKADADHVHTWEEIEEKPDIPVATDVRINGTSIVEDGVANIPVASGGGVKGVVSGASTYGTVTTGDGYVKVQKASDEQIKARNSHYVPIVPVNLNTAVKSALTDAKRIGVNGDGLTSAEMDNACAVLGAVRDAQYTLIKTVTATESMSLDVSTDLSGQPLNLNRVFVLATCPREQAASTGVTVHAYNGTNKRGQGYINTNSGTSAIKRGYCIIDTSNGLWKTEMCAFGTSGIVTMQTYSLLTDVYPGEKITRVNILNIIAGYTVTIYGL